MELKEELKLHLQTLRDLLKARKHGGVQFFDTLIELVDSDFEDCIERILPAYSMTQHSGFNFEEEAVFIRLWNCAKTIKNSG